MCGKDFDTEIIVEELRDRAASLRVIADHARATTFLVTDGVVPSNEGRGYVLRKIMRRAIYHGRLLGATEPFLSKMIYTVRDILGGAYPELLSSSSARVVDIVLAEEEGFGRTLAIGLKKLGADLVPCRQSTLRLEQLEIAHSTGIVIPDYERSMRQRFRRLLTTAKKLSGCKTPLACQLT